MICGKNAPTRGKGYEVHSLERHCEFVVETQTMRRNQTKETWTYADLLTNLLVNDDVDECSRDGHAVLAGHQILEAHL